jgi:hypothetical protein
MGGTSVHGMRLVHSNMLTLLEMWGWCLEPNPNGSNLALMPMLVDLPHGTRRAALIWNIEASLAAKWTKGETFTSYELYHTRAGLIIYWKPTDGTATVQSQIAIDFKPSDPSENDEGSQCDASTESGDGVPPKKAKVDDRVTMVDSKARTLFMVHVAQRVIQPMIPQLDPKGTPGI